MLEHKLNVNNPSSSINMDHVHDQNFTFDPTDNKVVTGTPSDPYKGSSLLWYSHIQPPISEDIAPIKNIQYNCPAQSVSYND